MPEVYDERQTCMERSTVTREDQMLMGDNGRFREEKWRCDALLNPGTWPYAKRCINDSTVTTGKGSHYCNLHEGLDD